MLRLYEEQSICFDICLKRVDMLIERDRLPCMHWICLHHSQSSLVSACAEVYSVKDLWLTEPTIEGVREHRNPPLSRGSRAKFGTFLYGIRLV